MCVFTHMYGTKNTDKIILFLRGKKVLSIFNFYITALRGDSFMSAKVTSLLQLLLALSKTPRNQTAMRRIEEQSRGEAMGLSTALALCACVRTQDS